MAIASTTLGINAAFLQEIKEDHIELRDLLVAVRTLAAERHPPIDQLTDKLEQLRDRLSFHFALEEAYGYYNAEISDTAPWLAEKASALRAQHVELFLLLDQRVNAAEGVRYHESPRQAIGPLCRDVLDFCQRLEDHEQRENELILEAFDDDVGVGD